MASSSTVDQHLAEWLEAATVELSGEQHTQWRAAIAAMSKALDANLCLQITAAAHDDISDSARSWMGERLREQDPGFAPSGKDLLLSILAGAVLIETLETTGHRQRTLAFLLIDSAECTGLTPSISAIGTTSRRVGGEIRRSVRKRILDQKPISKEITDELAAVPKLDPAAPDQALIPGAVVAHDAALQKIAGRLFELNSQLAATIQLQEEELDTLWWSYGGQSTTAGEEWDKVLPIERRAVLASVELRGLITRTPSPPSSRALLARALGGDASSQTTIGRVAEATVEFLDDFGSLPEHRLTPIVSAARERQRVGGGDDTWKTVVARILGYETDSPLSTLDAAEQILRELDMRPLF